MVEMKIFSLFEVTKNESLLKRNRNKVQAKTEVINRVKQK